MDQRMWEAATSGDTNTLHQLLQQNPFILSDHTLLTRHGNPIAVAAKANRPVFVREVLRLKPELAKEPDPDGLRPLDVASAYGNLEVVREILRAGPEICRLAGRNGLTAVHHAARNGHVEVVDELIRACPECVKDVSYFGETALHLAVKCCKFEAFGRVIDKGNMMEVVNFEDREGNTVLHYAVLRKQLRSVELLLEWNERSGNKLDLNIANKKGLTPLDILDIFIESSTDLHLREILHRVGAQPSQIQIISDGPKPITIQPEPKNWEDILKYFEFQWGRDSPGQARETLLLIVALIATVTFEAGINPPDYLARFTVTTDEAQTRIARTASMVTVTVFLVANSVALSTAVSIIDYLTVGLPFQRELRVSIFSMGFAYCWSAARTEPTGRVKEILLYVATCMPLILRVLPYTMSKLRRRVRDGARNIFHTLTIRF